MGHKNGLDELVFAPLSAVAVERYVELMNLQAVGWRLPLLTGAFAAEDCRAFLNAKQRMWDEHGFGPSAIMIGGRFAGWGGLQPEQGEADFALVLRPEFWGWGRKIFNKVKQKAFGPLGLASITILLPPGRPNVKALSRLGFVEDGATSVGEVVFNRFRLLRIAKAQRD